MGLPVNVIDSDTNKAAATVPTSLLEMKFDNAESINTRAYIMPLLASFLSSVS